MQKTISFIGLGKMAEALIKAFKSSTHEITISGYDISTERCDHMKNNYNISISKINDILQSSDIIILAVKPQNLDELLPKIQSYNNLLISIAAGYKIEKIEKIISQARVIRVMPNTPCLINQMAGALALGLKATEEDKNIALELFSSAGEIFEIEENKLDVVTALSGSGPAYVSYFIKSMTKVAEEKGLDKEIASKLAIKTFLGTAALLLEKNLTPDELINMVSSPGGTTLAGREKLEDGRVSKAVKETIDATYKRSIELSK